MKFTPRISAQSVEAIFRARAGLADGLMAAEREGSDAIIIEARHNPTFLNTDNPAVSVHIGISLGVLTGTAFKPRS
jgi:hypothetical protein